jgi:methyltransferase-like protein
VEFRCVSLPEFTASGETFDYVLAMDLYSWLSEALRDKLLALCRDHLAAQGVAYVNYNVNPGWQLHDMLGVMMRFEARSATTAAQQLAAGRQLLEFARETLPADDGYGELVSATAQSILKQPDAVLIRDYLQGRSHAVYYPDFDDHARRHELQVLGDAGLGIRTMRFLPPADEQRLNALTDDPREKERMRDIVHDIAHRQSILCRAEVPLEFKLTATRLHGMYLEGRLTPIEPQAAVESGEPATFATPDGAHVSTSVPILKAALMHLGALWPRRITCEELHSAARARVEAAGRPVGPQEAERLENHVLQCCLDDLFQLHTEPAPFAAEPGERPRASQLARQQALRGDIVTSRRHLPIRLDPMDRLVLSQLDGAADMAQLGAHVSAAVASGKIALLEEGQPVPPERAEAFIQQQLAACIARLAEHALLIEPID